MCPAFWAAPATTVPRPLASGRHTPRHQPIGTAVLPPDRVISPLAQTICPGHKCRVPPNRAPPGEQAHGSAGRAGPAHRAWSTPVRGGPRTAAAGPPPAPAAEGPQHERHRRRPGAQSTAPAVESAPQSGTRFPRQRPIPRGRRQRAGLRCLGVRGGGGSVIGGRHRPKMRSMTMWLGSFLMLFPALCKESVAGSPSTRRSSTAGAFHQDQGEERLSSCKTCHQFPPLHRKAGAPSLARRERLGMMPPQASPQPR